MHLFQCFPLFSLLTALDQPTVNLLSLDIEGAEFPVLQTLPWDQVRPHNVPCLASLNTVQVDIEVMLIELEHAGKVFPGSRCWGVLYCAPLCTGTAGRKCTPTWGSGATSMSAR